ncbi:MAG: SDR family oxidoreductase [Deltaproteobacteria bacterium]|nr:SDR family oxidoreductase [Deltaproteobacteria bacterium]
MVKSVLITGASRGIGFEFTGQYAAAGWQVHACCRRPDDTSFDQGVHVHALDVTDQASINDLASSLDGTAIDLLINNAAIFGGPHQDVGDTFDDQWELVMRTNVIAPFRVTDALRGHLSRAAQPVVVHISSLAGSIADNRSGGIHLYRTSKTALNMVAANLARDLAGDRITVLALHPGWVRTDMGGKTAPLSTKESVAGMRKVIASASFAMSGGFFDYNGRPLPW